MKNIFETSLEVFRNNSAMDVQRFIGCFPRTWKPSRKKRLKKEEFEGINVDCNINQPPPCSPLQFTPHTQDKLKKVYQTEEERKKEEKYINSAYKEKKRPKKKEFEGQKGACNAEQHPPCLPLQFTSHTQEEKRFKGKEYEGGKEAQDTEQLPFFSSLQFSSHNQDELKKIYGTRAEREEEAKKYINADDKDSESSEDEEGISVEELKNSIGYKLILKALDEWEKSSVK